VPTSSFQFAKELFERQRSGERMTIVDGRIHVEGQELQMPKGSFAGDRIFLAGDGGLSRDPPKHGLVFAVGIVMAANTIMLQPQVIGWADGEKILVKGNTAIDNIEVTLDFEDVTQHGPTAFEKAMNELSDD